jgi:hypothetical protein
MERMTAPWAAAARALAADLQGVFGTRLYSVVAYGPRLDGHASAPLTALALVSSLGVGDLEACGRLEAGWRRGGVATPLIQPRHEFESSLDVFPLEYGEIIRAHAHVFGPDPFVGITIGKADLRHACETQIKSHLVHLREGYIEAAGRLEAVADLVKEAAPPFAALLRNVARLHGVESHDRMDATRQGAQAAGLTTAIVDAVLALEQPSTPPATDAARLFPEYLAAVEQLARAVDAWRT